MDFITTLKPENYIITSFEKQVFYLDGTNHFFEFPQPIERLKGKTYYEYDENSIERNNWGKFTKQSNMYKDCLAMLNHKSEVWENEKAKQKTFKFIYDFHSTRGKEERGSPTKLFPFEIMLLNNEFEMVSYSHINVQMPSGRIYIKDNKIIEIRFGLVTEKRQVDFYFMFIPCHPPSIHNPLHPSLKDQHELSKRLCFFQINNDPLRFDDAINGLLPIIEL